MVVEKLLQQERDLAYYAQFCINIMALLRGTREPAVLLQCSDDVRGLTGAVWDELVAYKKTHNPTILQQRNAELEEKITKLQKRAFLERLLGKKNGAKKQDQ